MINTSNYYQLYIENVLQFVETIVIKSVATAQAINAALYRKGVPVDTQTPSSWKYYLNLAGEYHPSDEVMTVVSMDTREQIVFSKPSLEIHLATARGYVYGTREYLELVARYPEQEMLILGILYPVDIDDAIAAPDGKILGYPPGFIEPNEYSLEKKLQGWIDGYRGRWVINAFRQTDDLYTPVEMGLMYMFLVMAVINFRLEACKTNEAHSYHVRQYLGSHGYLDTYMDAMTTEQALFFYRNMTYIERNAGKDDTFKWLVEHIMTKRQLPLAEYVMRHDLSEQPAEFYPTPVFRRSPLNLDDSVGSMQTRTLQQLLYKELPLARDNSKYVGDEQPKIEQVMKNSPSNVVLTKVLESSIVDYSNSSPYTLEDILMNHWGWLAHRGQYKPYITLTNPQTGEAIPLTVKEAYVFAIYAFAKSIGFSLDVIPKMYARRVQRFPTPTAAQIRTVTDYDLIPLSLAQQMVDLQPVIGDIVSTEAFYNTCRQIFIAANRQRDLVAQQQHHVGRAMALNMSNQLYQNVEYSIVPTGTLFGPWFADLNVKLSDFSVAELALMYVEAVRKATGMELNTTDSLRNMQRSMVRLLSRLSSYSIQIVAEINATDIRKSDWGPVTVGNIATRRTSAGKWPDMAVTVIDVNTVSYREVKYSFVAPSRYPTNGIYGRHKANVKLAINVSGSARTRKHVRVAFIGVGLNTPPGAAPNQNPLPGLAHYESLTLQQQQSLRDVYNTNYTTADIPINPDLAGDVDDTDLDGLEANP